MSDLNCNLIDLNLEDEVPSSNMQTKNGNSEKLAADISDFIPSTWCKRDSLGNNPFDQAQKLADRLDDPFDIVEKEVCLKTQACNESGEVKLGNLLSLSDDNLLKEEDKHRTPLVTETCENDLNVEVLDLESPPILFNEKYPSDSVSGSEIGSTPNSSSETSTSVKLKRNMEYRKKLLKLSVKNATFNSPIICEPNSKFGDMSGTPVSSMLSRAAEFGENSLASESPLKLVEDEDLILEDTSKILDADKNFEADLEMLSIPILNDLPSPTVEQISTKYTEDTTHFVSNSSADVKNDLTNLEVIKAKLKAKKEEINSNHKLEISVLIQNLKTLISSGEMIDSNKRQQANDLLESLSSTLKPSNVEEVIKTSELLDVPAKPIRREGTFDMDLNSKPESNNENQTSVQEIPNCMVSSSATYDGESSNDKQNLNLPEIAPLSPQHVPSKECYPDKNSNDCVDHSQTDVNNIVEQLSKILINNSAENPSNCSSPTFIVVMNANALNQSNTNYLNQNDVDGKLRSAFVANYLENDGSPDLTKFDPISRRRSQSLSIHDKIKIVHLPLQQPTPQCKRNHSVQMDESPPINSTLSGEKETSEFKTPARLRRNSYSSGTPYTTQVGTVRTGICSEKRNVTKMRRTQNMDTHHEGDNQAIVRPISIASNNLMAFKPDLKKKSKLNTESIMKSSGPLKATIPVKKVAPMLKTSAATPEKITKTKILMPRTPLSTKLSSRLGEAAGYPNASSTPSTFSSPLKRTPGPANKPRYSYMPTTPSPKSSLNNSSSSSLALKRRTITEFKAKSPLKPRVSSVGLAAGALASSFSSPAATARLSIVAGAKICKTPIKATTANTVSIKPSSRLSYRASVGGSVMSARNKENKRPS